MNVRWAKMHPDSGSWHALQDESERGVHPDAVPRPTLCGREADGPVEEDLPANVKGCESCKTIVVRTAEAIGALG